jgi:hypothetical protein
MKSQLIQNEIDEDRAAALLGMTGAQLRLLCEQAGLTHGTPGNDPERRTFSYRDLHRLCRRVIRQAS